MSALLVGYARCSTDAQDLTAQRDALLGLGVEAERIYVDHGLTGTNRERPGLREALAAKHGLVGLTKVTALETAQTGITCNAICPGWVLTPLVQKQVDARAAEGGISNEEAKRNLLAEKQPSGEFVTPEQLGALAVFMCSEAASQVRGVAWNMDGGWVAQ